MTATYDALRYHRALERWCALAERRLEHMTLLHETGRWRRYFSEEEFIGLIRETRAGVEAWRRLVPEPEQAAQVYALSVEPAFARTQPPPSPFETEAQRSVA